MKTFGYLLLAVILTLSIISCAPSPGSKTTSTGSYKIGTTFPLTGPAADFAKNFLKGIDFATEEINNQGGIKKGRIELIHEDSKADPTTGVTAFRKLATVDKVPVVLSAWTGVTLAQIPVAESTKTILYSNTMLPGLTNKSQWVFRNMYTSDLQARAGIEVMKKKGLRKVAVLYVDDESGRMHKDIFETEAPKAGIQVVAAEVFSLSATDFRSQITKFIAAKPDTVWVGAMGGKAEALAFKQMAELGLTNVQLLSTMVVETPEFLQIAGTAAEGIVFNAGLTTSAEFVNKWQAKFREEPQVWSTVFYEAIKLIARAIETDGYTSEGISRGLLKIKDFPAPGGPITFLPNRDVAYRPFELKMIKEGKFVRYSP